MSNQSFTDQKRRIATKGDIETRWGLDGKSFYCGLCGHRFVVGDGWRWVYANDRTPSAGNFFVCDACDGPDVLQIRQKAIELSEQKQNDKFVLAAMLIKTKNYT